jgi:hypothetical protein
MQGEALRVFRLPLTRVIPSRGKPGGLALGHSRGSLP